MSKPLFRSVVLFLAAIAGTAMSCPPDRIPGPTSFAVYSAYPSNGAPQGGTEVAITGAGFRGQVGVRFGSQTGTVTSVTDARITVTTPASTESFVEVVVTNGNGDEAKVGGGFRFNQVTVSGISPSAAFPLEYAFIHGANHTAGSRVEFGGMPAEITSVTLYGLSVKVPDRQPGVVDVVVTHADGRTFTLAKAFTFLGVDVTATPASLAAGAALTVSWSNPRDNYWDYGPDTIGLFRLGDSNPKAVWSEEVWYAVSSMTLAAPAEPGDYEFRFLINNGAYVAGRSKVITIVGAQAPALR